MFLFHQVNFLRIFVFEYFSVYFWSGTLYLLMWAVYSSLVYSVQHVLHWISNIFCWCCLFQLCCFSISLSVLELLFGYIFIINHRFTVLSSSLHTPKKISFRISLLIWVGIGRMVGWLAIWSVELDVNGAWELQGNEQGMRLKLKWLGNA